MHSIGSEVRLGGGEEMALVIRCYSIIVEGTLGNLRGSFHSPNSSLTDHFLTNSQHRYYIMTGQFLHLIERIACTSPLDEPLVVNPSPSLPLTITWLILLHPSLHYYIVVNPSPSLPPLLHCG